MSYDLSVSVRSWPAESETRWLDELRFMGIAVSGFAELALSSASGWHAATVTITPTSTGPYAREFRALGSFESGFELMGSAERAMFSAKSLDGNAVAVWFASALAAVTGGTLEDPQVGIKASGQRGVEVLSKLMRHASFTRSFCGPETMGALPPLKPAVVAVTAPEFAMDLTRPVRAYATAASFDVGDRVKHPTFGEGVVEVSEPGKVTVFFTGGRRILVQGRDGTRTS